MALLWIGSTTAFGTALRKNRAEPAGLFRDDRYDRKMPNYPVEWESIRQEAAPVRGLARGPPTAVLGFEETLAVVHIIRSTVWEVSSPFR